LAGAFAPKKGTVMPFRYGMALTASIVAVPPCSGCCLLGLPAGIWRPDHLAASGREKCSSLIKSFSSAKPISCHRRFNCSHRKEQQTYASHHQLSLLCTAASAAR
jgi:hypothetical protein